MGNTRPVPWAIDKRSTAGFVLALVLLVAVGVGSQLGTLRLTQTSHWVVHSGDVLRAIEEGKSALRQAEASQGRYLLGGAAADLQAFQAAEQRTRLAFQRLQTITADRPAQQQRALALAPFVHKELALLQEEVSGRRERLPEKLAAEHEASLKIDAIAEEMRRDESAWLAARTLSFQSSAHTTNLFVEWANLLAIVLVTSGLLLINRSTARRREAESALQRAHNDLELRVAERTCELAEANQALEAEIEERKKAQEKMAQLAAIVQSSDDAIFSMNFDGSILTWNRGAEHLYGYAADEVIGRSAGVLLPMDAVDELPGQLVTIRRGDGVPGYETCRVGKYGRRVEVWATVSPIRDAAGAIVGVSSVTRDISDKKRLEAQYRQAQKMEAIGRLAGGVAHDFNNLLTVITCADDLLLSRAALDAASRDLIEQSKRAAERASSLTRQLLAFSRQQVLVNRVIDLNVLVSDMHKMLRRLIGEDVELVTELDPEVHPVKADPSQIEQVIMNLAVNARDAMPRGGRLRIETSNVHLDATYAQARPEVRPGPYAMIAVTDTGCGMDTATKARIFEPFFTTKEPGKGTGLGLATVYGIVKQSDGYIYVQSEPGRGTTFKVYLPRSESMAGPATPTGNGDKKPSVGFETILLAEDEDEVRVLSMQILQQAGYQVLEVSNGRQALETAERHVGPIHLLLSDVVMPKLSGRELADALVRLHPETKVLFLSGYMDDAIMRHGVLSGAADFLHKPFDPATLLRKVREVLDKKTTTPAEQRAEERAQPAAEPAPSATLDELDAVVEPGELALSRLVDLSAEPRRRTERTLPRDLAGLVSDPGD
jgi:PAS domain S-box-containing protein